MNDDTDQALRRSLIWSAILSCTLATVGAYGMAHNHSLHFLWLLGAPFALLLPMSFLIAAFIPSVAGWFAGVVVAAPIGSMCVSCVIIGHAWGLGFLWPHLAYRSSRQRKFLIRTWAFLGWSAFSIVGTMGFMFWAISGMMD